MSNETNPMNITQEQIEAAEAAMRPVLEAMLAEIPEQYATAKFGLNRNYDGQLSADWGVYNGSGWATGATPQVALDDRTTEKQLAQRRVESARQRLAEAEAKLKALEVSS
jgi:ribosomal protein L16/L10AE